MSYDIRTLEPIKQHWLLRNSNIPYRFLGMETTDLVTEFPPVVVDWLADMQSGSVIKSLGGLGVTGVGLLLDGGPGLGKTTLAAIAATEFIRHLPEEKMAEVLKYAAKDVSMTSRPIYYLTYAEFVSRKKAVFDLEGEEKRELQRELEGFHGRAKEDWLNVRLLILDDLGKEYGSSFNDAAFDEVLRSRYDRALPTIVTTNELLDSWGMKYGKAMESFANEAFHRVRLQSKDLRRARA